jgi:hypothetical protein
MIRDKIRNFTGLKKAFNYLKVIYKLNNIRALKITETKIVNLIFNIHKLIIVFIN